jgi:hypothetical protein
MNPSPNQEKKLVQEQQPNNKREEYQTPDIVYEGTISIRACSPIGFTNPGDPFGLE